MPKERKHRSRNLRGGRFWGLYVLFAAVVVALVVLGGSIVFFKVNNFDLRMRTPSGNVVSLEGNSRYTEEEIIEASGVSYRDNLVLVKKTSVASSLLSHLSYVSGVSVTRRLPGTLIITITESQEAAAIQSGDEWFTIDASGKILESGEEPPELPQVVGLVLDRPVVGKTIQVYESPSGSYKGMGQAVQRECLLLLLPALEGRSLLAEMDEIDLSSGSEISMRYQDRLTIKMPLDADFEYGAKMISSVLDEYIAVNWSKKDTGVLDMTYDDGQPHLTRDRN